MESGDVYYQAMRARDFRFDGKFYVGVKTTGVYCRPICPAKPKRQNVEFFPSAHLAEKKGYRPCLRCRPESAPQSPAWFGKSALVQRALKAISDQECSGSGENAFAARFGVSPRHLRRLFEGEIGKTPKRIILENRLNFARTLIVETPIALGEIAFASGFSSIRRFNDAIKDRFKRPPSQLRKRRPANSPREELTLSLPYRPPFAWAACLAYYRSHGIAGLETFADGGYERVFRFGKTPGWARVTHDPDGSRLRVQLLSAETRILSRLVQTIRRMFDLDSDPLLIANAFANNSHLEKLYRKQPGLRAPRGWDPFEIAISSILGQLVSIGQANRMISQLVDGYGESIRHPVSGAGMHLFPTPEALATAELDKVGTTGSRKATLREFSRRVAEGRLSLSSTQDPAGFRKSLLDIQGIGLWTAEYISLRCIADTDAFPATDLILKRSLQANPEIELECVRPWRGYAAAYLWNGYSQILSKQRKSRETVFKNPHHPGG
jgi:AraC family transcriptional regulator, regulatory protein of adaptative response / DNA-3-methyladenine glycosylase II